LVRAAAAQLQGDADGAAAMLRRAVQGFDDTETGLHAAAARWRLGEVAGGDEGGVAREEAEGFMRAQGIENPAGMVNMLAPGFERNTC
jgi:hypothetical protein